MECVEVQINMGLILDSIEVYYSISNNYYNVVISKVITCNKEGSLTIGALFSKVQIN